MKSITLIIPVYNGEKFLSALLESVIAQTFDDWDCICVNDGSTDGSAQILDSYARKDQRFKIVNQRNGGCGTARNTAINLADSRYIMFADQDDLLHPQSFEIAYNHAEKANADCLCFGFSQFTDKPDFQHLNNDWNISYETKRQGLDLITGRRDSWTIFVWRHIFKTESVRSIPFPPISGGEDQAWMSELSWNKLVWASIPTVLYANRERPDSQSRGISRRYIDCVFSSYEWIRRRAAQYSVDGKWLTRYIRHMAVMYVASVIYRSPRQAFYALGKLRRCLFSGS